MPRRKSCQKGTVNFTCLLFIILCPRSFSPHRLVYYARLPRRLWAQLIHLNTWLQPNAAVFIAPVRKIRLCDSACDRNETYPETELRIKRLCFRAAFSAIRCSVFSTFRSWMAHTVLQYIIMWQISFLREILNKQTRIAHERCCFVGRGPIVLHLCVCFLIVYL